MTPEEKALLDLAIQYYAKQNQDALAQTQENNNSQSLGPIL